MDWPFLFHPNQGGREALFEKPGLGHCLFHFPSRYEQAGLGDAANAASAGILIFGRRLAQQTASECLSKVIDF